jgi:phage shock protein PspC (stress-responsive transcriptional regulator)
MIRISCLPLVVSPRPDMVLGFLDGLGEYFFIHRALIHL